MHALTSVRNSQVSTMAFFLLCTSALLVIFIASYILQPFVDARRRLPPGPRRLPVIGNLHNIGRQPHRAFARLADRYGPLVSVRLGGVRAVVASSADAAREVLHRHNADLAGRGGMDSWHACGHHANSIIALPPRRKWRALRRLCTEELLSPRRLDREPRLRAVREEEARELARRVSAEAAGGAPVAVARAVFAAVTGVLWRSMFSEGMSEATARRLREVVEEAVVVAAAPNPSDYFPALAAVDVLGVRRRMEKLIGWVYGVIDEQIEERRRRRAAGEARKHDLLDVALDMEGEVEGEGWEMNQDSMKGMFTDLLIAGSGSTSSTIEWAMAELLQNPASMRKAQEELEGVLGTRGNIEEFDITHLRYLQAVVKETLRLHSTVPIAFNKAEATVEVQGYKIPRGTTIYVNIWAICRKARAWASSEKFMPERFLGEGNGGGIGFQGTDFELIPFGAGRRICLGMPLADRMLHLMLVSLLHRFTWSLPSDDVGGNGDLDMAERFGLVLSMATPLHAIAKEKWRL